MSSDLARAIATADRLAPRRRLPHDAALRELHFGAWELRGFAEVEAEDPARIRAFWDDPGDISPPGGESWNGMSARVIGALDRLMRCEPGDLIVVSHFGPILAAIQHADHLSASAAFAHRIDNLSVTEIDVAAGTWSLIRANHHA